MACAAVLTQYMYPQVREGTIKDKAYQQVGRTRS